MGIKNIKYVPELDRLENSMHFFFIMYPIKKLTERNILSYSNLQEKIICKIYNILYRI